MFNCTPGLIVSPLYRRVSTSGPLYCGYSDFSTLYTTLPHNLIKDKLVDLIERSFKGKALFILHVMIGMLSSHLMQTEIIIYGLVRKCVKLSPFS